MGKRFTFRKDKWASKRIDERHDSFVTIYVQAISYPSANFVSLLIEPVFPGCEALSVGRFL